MRKAFTRLRWLVVILEPDCGAHSLIGIDTVLIPIPTLTAAEAIVIFGLVGLVGKASITGDDIGAVQVFILDSALSKLLMYAEYCFMYAM